MPLKLCHVTLPAEKLLLLAYAVSSQVFVKLEQLLLCRQTSSELEFWNCIEINPAGGKM